MKMFVTKHALSGGIKEVDLEPRHLVGTDYFADRYNLYRLGATCHRTMAEACTAADLMRLKRIASLRKSIAKLEKLTFEAAP